MNKCDHKHCQTTCITCGELICEKIMPKPQEWIKCTERLPKDEDHCWVCDIDNDVFDMRFCESDTYYDIDLKEYNAGPCFESDLEFGAPIPAYKITHWMHYETPAPPKV